MKTLVIHPYDLSTGFLEPIYDGKGYTVIDYNPSSKELKTAIKNHDIIIMLGHGDPNGLMGFHRYIIDSSLVYLLREKTCVYIWCYAKQFVEKYGLKGFYTDMFISEEPEATYLGILATWQDISTSNDLFAESVNKHLNKPDMLELIKADYCLDSEVGTYNRDRLFLRD